ncbi:GUN4 domain-containing protein [Baaleninema simplex]|uniref:GUN4 domain-containing protein n=1 Tax=Baaleninema simplex TaxID=2862350 RepID=UPI000A014A96|nr:GUN4 domain-containing protein [Baaleninema simplex]
MPEPPQHQNSPSQPSKPQPSSPDTLETERKVARQFLTGTAQTLIQWMPMGGSGWASISFALNQEWFMVLLMFPVMCVTVVWAAYTQSVLARLREIYQERGRQDVDSFMAWQKKIDEAIRWQFAGIEDKYVCCQGNACREYLTEGYRRGSFVPLLSEVFVPLELSSVFVKGDRGEELPLLPGFREEDLEQLRTARLNELSIWDLLANVKQFPAYSRMVVLAWGGYGKTTLLRHITYTYAKHRHRRYNAPKLLPVLLYLRHWQEKIATEPNLDLPGLIEQHHLPSLPEGESLTLPPQWVKKQLRDGKMLVMFDGFDEVKPEWRKPVSQWLDKQMRSYQPSVFILTSRPGGYKDYVAANPPQSKLYVKPFNAEQRERFVRQWYLTQERYARAGRNTPEVKQIAKNHTVDLLQQLQARPELETLARNPLLLNIIANLHRSYGAQQLPQRRSELYQDILTLQLKDRPRDRGIDMLVPFPESQQVLQKVALTWVRQNQTSSSRQNLENEISRHLQGLDRDLVVDRSAFLDKIVEVGELIVKRDENLEFAHLSFQGYLAAVEVKEQKQESLLLENWQASWWKETILLYCARVNPSRLVRHLLDSRSQEAVTLADECLNESPRKVQSEILEELQQLKSQVSNLLYQQLETYLKNGQWKEADRETYRVMIQKVGKEEGQWFDREDIENFPCEDLRTIDRLWRQYSNDRFGFSVQKEIYKSLSSTFEYNTRVWIEFSEAVGWRKGENWLDYDYLTFSVVDAPVGHLPHGGLVERDVWVVLSSLAQRLVTCKI